jgi:DUF4097 and DUF4098 domain-containing protein YvlB
MKMRGIGLGAAALALPVCLFAAEYRDTYQRTFQLGSGARKVSLAILTGDVIVVGDSGNDVRITVNEYWEDAEDRNDAKLEFSQGADGVRIELDGPFKRQNRRRSTEEFRHDIEIHAPRDIELDLKTLNGKTIRARGTRGPFKIRSLNSAVELTDVIGSGSAETLNGPVTVRFAENPAQASSFKTLNGTLDVAFQPGLSADLTVRTMSGDLYTDFDVLAPAGSNSNRGHQQIRVGSGGVTHSFSTLNGLIKIRKNAK